MAALLQTGALHGLSATGVWARAAVGDERQRLGFSLRSVGAKPDVWPRSSSGLGAVEGAGATGAAGTEVTHRRCQCDNPWIAEAVPMCECAPTRQVYSSFPAS
jgi:hypothetical protein